MTGNNANMSTLITLIQHSAGSPSQCIETRKANKRHTVWKERNKTKHYIFADDMIIDMEIPKNPQKQHKTKQKHRTSK